MNSKYLEMTRHLSDKTFVFHKYASNYKQSDIITDLYIWNRWLDIYSEPYEFGKWTRVAIDSTGGTDFLGQREAYRRRGICTMVVKRKRNGMALDKKL